jgi:hypothetical protein
MELESSPDEQPLFRVVVNDEEQYSIWPYESDIPRGWYDVDVRGLKLTDLRQSIGFVSQDPFLFDGTVAARIGWGRTPGKRRLGLGERHREIGEVLVFGDFGSGSNPFRAGWSVEVACGRLFLSG